MKPFSPVDALATAAAKSRAEALEICIKEPPKPLSFLGTSFASVEQALYETFGPLPIQLSKFEHETVLKGMAAAAGEGGTPYKQMLEALQTYDEIEVRRWTSQIIPRTAAISV